MVCYNFAFLGCCTIFLASSNTCPSFKENEQSERKDCGSVINLRSRLYNWPTCCFGVNQAASKLEKEEKAKKAGER